MSVSIVARDGHLIVTTPLHPDFPVHARTLGGAWDGARGLWLFDPKDAERVRTLCRDIYGTDSEQSGKPLPAGINSNSRQFADGALPYDVRHRNRSRERMLAAGPEDLSDYQLLELILLAAQQRGDVKPAAKALIAKFGSFAAVFAADQAALAEAGLNLAGISAIKLVHEAGLRLMHERGAIG